jgi:hypothetical protein
VGKKVLDPLRACVKIADCCDPSSASTVTYIKTLATSLRAFCHRIQTIHNSGLFSFVLMKKIRFSYIASSNLIKEA